MPTPLEGSTNVSGRVSDGAPPAPVVSGRVAAGGSNNVSGRIVGSDRGEP